MAALSALLPIANIEKSQQYPNKQESTSASKQADKAAQSLEDQDSADEKEQKRHDKESSEFSLMYQEDLRAYGDAEPLDSQPLTPLTEAEFMPLNADEPISTTLFEGNVLPLNADEPIPTTLVEGNVLPLTGDDLLLTEAESMPLNADEPIPITLVEGNVLPLIGDDLPLTQVQLSAGAESITNKPDVVGWQKEQADMVRSWRGITPREGVSLQVGTQDFSKPIQAMGQQGQMQQFSESLRASQTSTEAIALTPDKALSTAAPTTSSAESVSAWRQESTPQATTLQARSGQNSSFAQTLNAQSFNSKLGQTFGTNAWAESVSQRVSLMTAQRLGSATIELDPPELGAMTVKVSLDGDKASVNFMSANGQVREALEQSFPRLQEMLGQQGLQLADAQVSDKPSTGQNSGDSQSSGDQKSSRGSDELNGESSVHSVNVPTGLIDYYA